MLKYGTPPWSEPALRGRGADGGLEESSSPRASERRWEIPRAFYYVRPDKVLVPRRRRGGHHVPAISGAALSANVSTPLSTSVLLLPSDDSTASSAAAASSGFESSESFAVVPLQPVPRFLSGSICVTP
jgi:hypothetical protein